MVVNINIFQRTSYALAWLVFSFLSISCRQNKKEEDRKIVIATEENRPTSMIIPREILKGLSEKSIRESLRIHLQESATAMLGELIISEDDVIFEPLIAFTRGSVYEVRLKGELLENIAIRSANNRFPATLSVYPSADTLPENTIKFYIGFSKHMQQGSAADNIVLIRNGKDTLSNVFFDLQTELWNSENSILTVWLDPGRVKQDLQPNKKMGPPLEQGNHYQLLIKSNWQDIEGMLLHAPYHKDFVAGPRDSMIPNYHLWDIHSPRAGTLDPLEVRLHESLDYLLLKNAVRITDNGGNSVRGFIHTREKETVFAFTPTTEWKAGDYILEIESRLEDLAGNNLNRLFDRDITKKDNGESKKVHRRPFSIK